MPMIDEAKKGDRELLLATLKACQKDSIDDCDGVSHMAADHALLEYIGDDEVYKIFCQIYMYYA
jgi:hypothetical protein